MHASRFGRGTVLRVEPEAPSYELESGEAVSVLEAVAVLDEQSGALTVFAVNRGATALPLEVALRDLDGVRVEEHIMLADPDIAAANTADAPDRVAPRQGAGATVEGDRLRAELAPRSWNVVRLAGGVLEARP